MPCSVGQSISGFQIRGSAARLFHSGLGGKDRWSIRATGVAGHSWNEFASIFNAISAHGKLLAEEGDTLALALPLACPDHSRHQKSH